MKNPTLLLTITALAAAIQTVSAQVMFTTTNDFSGWTPNDGSTVGFRPATTFSSDSSAINGGGNQSGPGGTSDSGSLGITWGINNFTGVAFSPGLAYLPSFMHAVDPGSLAAFNAEAGFGPGTTTAYSGVMQMVYTVPDDESGGGGYFQLGLILNYSGNFGFFFPSSTIDLGFAPNGQDMQLATIPYTINAVNAGLNYFSLGIAYNSNYQPVDEFYVDQIAVVPEPTTTALFGSGIAVLAFYARRRRA